MKSIREILVVGEKGINRLLHSEAHRTKLSSLIHNPYTQLKCVELAESHVELESSLSLSPIDSFATLETSLHFAREILTLFKEKIPISVNSLKLQSSISPKTTTSVFEGLIEGILSKVKGLKDLSLRQIHAVSIPFLPELEKLHIFRNDRLQSIHINYTKSLHSLRLSECSQVADVSSLGDIYDLQLHSCDDVIDISSLNNNYRIAISACLGIIDYSKSFRHSKVIFLRIPWTRCSKIVSLDSAIAVRRLTLHGTGSCEVAGGNILKLPPSPRLNQLALCDIPASFALPLNTLRQLAVVECRRFSSCQNLGTIASIKLIRTGITSLDGLGVGNRVVHFEPCDKLEIEDYSPLQYCDEVTLSVREGYSFIDTRPLFEVKVVRIIFRGHHYHENVDIQYLTNVTDLEITGNRPWIYELINICSRLKSISITENSSNVQKIVNYLVNHPEIEKIIFSKLDEKGKEIIEQFKSDVTNHFLVESPYYSSTTTLIRRR